VINFRKVLPPTRHNLCRKWLP